MTVDERSASDVLRDAIAMERDGMSFFERASLMMTRERSKDMFLGLVAQERMHVEVLSHELDLLARGADWAPLDEARRAPPSAGTSVFPSDAASEFAIDPGAGELEVIDVGIEVETRSIEYYRSAGATSSNVNAKQVFDWLVEEESGHLEILRAERDSRSGSGFYYDQMEFSLEKE